MLTLIQGFINDFCRWQRSKRREIDVAILWPTIRHNAENIEDARAAFRLHCQSSSDWVGDADGRIAYRHIQYME